MNSKSDKSPVELMVQEWNTIAADLGVSIETSFQVEVAPGIIVSAPVLVRNFGGRIGTLVFERYEEIGDYSNAIVEMGYGYSVLGPPFSEEYDRDTIISMLSEWEWTGDESDRPNWMKTGMAR